MQATTSMLSSRGRQAATPFSRCTKPHCGPVMRICRAALADQHAANGGSWKQQVVQKTSAAVLAAALLLGSPQATLANEVNLDANPVYDGANVIRSVETRSSLSTALRDLDQRTGFHVRVFTRYQVDASPDGPNPRKIWGSLDKKTVVVLVDPSSPNIISVPFIGDDVLAKLRRPFWTELESRFGNMFFVREQGDTAAVLGAMDALIDCLGRDEGCRVVPGLPQEQYLATLWCSIAGGLVAGFVSKIEPQGIVQRRWVWLLLFSPLWGSLFINFGLGPIVSRTADLAPIAGNTAAFLAAAVAPFLLQKMWDGEQSDDQGPGSGPAQRTTDSM